MSIRDRFSRSGKSEKNKPRHEGEVARRAFIGLAFKALMMIVLVAAGVIFLISSILGSSLFLPQTADGVLDSVEMPDTYTWSSESIRRVTFAGVEQEQQSAKSATVDIPSDKYMLLTAGVLPARTSFVSDGSITLKLDEAMQSAGSDYRLASDYCNGADAVSVSTVEMPSPDMIKAGDPKIVDDGASSFGERAWELSFHPTPELIQQMMWIKFFQEQSGGADFNWVISKDELEKIQNGDYTVDYASAWVTRDPRVITQIDLRFTTDNGSSWRLNAQYVQNNAAELDPLADTHITPPPCDGSGQTPAPGITTPAPETTTPETTTTAPAPETPAPETTTTTPGGSQSQSGSSAYPDLTP